ncbi:hypothetical protein LDENG_00068680 [Lucifuga dentata]|nr:hypothetical protein LDENG_00068680 [Lucifuga dentata]
MGTQGIGRRRSTNKERSTAEDDALNLIAREAEARLATKRAARAEAREIRMKELERQQKEIFQVQKKYYGLNTTVDDRVDSRWGDIEQWMEDSERYSRPSRTHTLSDDDERMSVGSRGSVRSSRLSDDSRVSRASKMDLQPTSYASSDLYSLNGLSSRNQGSSFNGYQLSTPLSQITLQYYRRPLEYGSYRSSGSRVSSRAGSARASPVQDNCGSVASFLRSAARDLDDVTIPDFSHVEDRDYLEKGSRAASSLTTTTLTSLGGTSSRRGSGDTSITLDPEASVREIKEIHELKDQIQDVETKYTQNLKEVKDVLAEVEEKYRKAMVSNAQLDNEKSNLMYQVDTLKDSLMELEELLSESRREYEEKVKEYEREKHAHTVLQFQFNEMKETLKQSEELLNEVRQLRMKQDGFVREISDLQETVEWKDKKIGALERQKEYTDAVRIERDELREEVVKLKDILKKHGIVLGPDLSINGEISEAQTDGLSSGDLASQMSQDSQTSPTEGNSMLGDTQDSQMRSIGEEELDPEQHREMLEEAKENRLSSDSSCNLESVSTLDTYREEPHLLLSTVENSVGESRLSKDFDIEINAKNVIICSSEVQEIITSPGVNDVEIEKLEREDLRRLNNQDLGEAATGNANPSVSEAVLVETSDDFRETSNKLSEKQVDRLDEAEGSKLIMANTDLCPQQEVIEKILIENFPDDLTPNVLNTKPQCEPENVDEAENDEVEEISSKQQPQGATGKKKKRKRRGKKKGGTQDKTEQKDAKDESVTENENNKREKAVSDNVPAAEREIDGSDIDTLKESGMEQVEIEQDEQNVLEIEEIDAVKSVESFSVETLEESRTDHVGDEQKDQILETEKAEAAESESNLSTSELINNSENTEVTNGPDRDQTDISTSKDVLHIESEVTDSGGDERVASTEEINFQCTANDPESSCDITNSSTKTEAESQDSRCVDAATESSNSPDDEDNMLAAPLHTDTEYLESSSSSEMPLESEESATENSNNINAEIEVSVAALEEINDDEDEGVEMEQESFFARTVSPTPNEEYSEIKLDGSDKEELIEEPEDSVQPENSSMPLQTHAEKSESCDKAESFLDAVIQADHLDDASSSSGESHSLITLQSMGQNDESNVEASLETEESNTIEITETSGAAKEDAEFGFLMEQDCSSEKLNSAEDQGLQNDQEGEISVCSLENQQDESSKDKRKGNNLSQSTEQDSDEEDNEEEGQSFDFDDMDVEAAMNLPLNSAQEEVEFMSQGKSNNAMSRQCEAEANENTETQQQTQDEPDQNDDNNCADDEGIKVDTLELGDVSEGDQNSSSQDKASSETGEKENICEQQTAEAEIGVTDKPRLSLEEEDVQNRTDLVAVESNSAENVKQAMALPVEEGLDAINYELQREDVVFQKTEGQLLHANFPLTSRSITPVRKPALLHAASSHPDSAPPPSISLAPPISEIRLRKLVDEREKMIEQMKKLKAQLEQKAQRNGTEPSSQDGEIHENGTDPNIVEIQRDANRQINELKFKLVKAEQEVTALEQNVTRLEGQVTRYKSASENAEKVEDELKAEKRKLQRELRSALDKIDELESNNSHLSKRLEKIKSSRGMAQTP